MTTLEQVANDGHIDDWSKIRSEISHHLNGIFNEFYGVDEPLIDPLTGKEYNLRQVLEHLQQRLETTFHDEPPFTVQRLAELVLYPRKYYSRTSPDKLIKALSSVLSVSTDIYPKVDFDYEIEQDEIRAKSMVSEVVFSSIPWSNESELDVVDTGIVEEKDEELEKEKREEKLEEEHLMKSDDKKEEAEIKEKS